MKVFFKIIIPRLTLFVLMSACSANVAADNLSPETTSESLSPSPLPDNVDMHKPEAADLYQGEILYADIPILQFMGADISEVIDALGEPLDVTSRPPSTDVAGIYVYDGLYFQFDADTNISSELEALNLVKNYIAGGDDSIFEPLSSSYSLTYKFKNSNYMIQYDSKMNDQYHLIHEYEFVIDDPESGEGHTSTANWYQVDIFTGEIIPIIEF